MFRVRASVRHPEIDLAHPRVGTDFVGRTGGEDFAVVEHGDAVGDREHYVISCSIISTDKIAGQSAISSIIRAVSAGDMPDVGSSSSSNFGSLASAGDLELSVSP